jgi:hypothetical protein
LSQGGGALRRRAGPAQRHPGTLPRTSGRQRPGPRLRRHDPRLTGQHLPIWIAAARDAGLPGTASFANGLEKDLDAVTNGLTMTWSSGPVEGRVNHIKMVKRQMFGRRTPAAPQARPAHRQEPLLAVLGNLVPRWPGSQNEQP